METVQLKGGSVHFQELTNGIVDAAMIESTIQGDIINTALFLSLVERSLISLTTEAWAALSPREGEQLREKTKQILARHGVIEGGVHQKEQPVQEEPRYLRMKPEEEPVDFTEEEGQWFAQAKDEGLKQAAKMLENEQSVNKVEIKRG